MSSKSKKTSTPHPLPHAISIAALVVSTAALLLSLALWSYTLVTHEQLSQQLLSTTVENGRQNECIAKSITPCTQEQINKSIKLGD